jgi:hypothetical protein
MIPQILNNATIDIEYTIDGESKEPEEQPKLSTVWMPGMSYVITFAISPTEATIFPEIVHSDTEIVIGSEKYPEGYYYIEAWGGDGGSGTNNGVGGQGAMQTGLFYFATGQIIDVVIGERGTDADADGAQNGAGSGGNSSIAAGGRGGNGGTNNQGNEGYAGAGGGGASGISIDGRISLVAGGGGGGGGLTKGNNTNSDYAIGNNGAVGVTTNTPNGAIGRNGIGGNGNNTYGGGGGGGGGGGYIFGGDGGNGGASGNANAVRPGGGGNGGANYLTGNSTNDKNYTLPNNSDNRPVKEEEEGNGAVIISFLGN